VEDHETLQTLTLIGQLADSLQHNVDLLLTHGVVSTSIVVSGILLSSDQLRWVEKLLVLSSTDGVNHGGLQIGKHSAGDILASTSVLVESLVRLVGGWLLGKHGSIGANAVLTVVELPEGGAELATSLANVKRDDLTHVGEVINS